MVTVIAGLAFAVFLVAQVSAVIAVQATRNDRGSPASGAMRRDRGVSVIWDSAN